MVIKTHAVDLLGPVKPEWNDILSADALEFVTALVREFQPRRQELLQRRRARQADIQAGQMPDFLPETAAIRQAEWQVAPAPADLRNRRVEITGPTDRKMVINALNSGANVFMADFEDANTPSWHNLIDGQANLYDAVRREIEFISPEGQEYSLKDQTATLAVRPRGWHLPEKHVLIDGQPISGSLFDFGLYFFHNAQEQLNRGSGPYFYLPKLQSHLEARLWNDVFNFAQDALGIPAGSIRATVLIEHILATFEMEEILYELREHSSGLNLGRWDYIFSYIKVFSHRSDFVLPDRAQVGMTSHFLRSAAELLTHTCHKRGAHAMGGMSAFIPRRDDLAANDKAINQVRVDKTREAGQGFDGAWVAHPGLVGPVKEVFDGAFEGDNQLDRVPEANVTAADLLAVTPGEVSETGFRNNIDVALQYIEAWLGGRGAVGIYYLMEDVATAEIARSQLWQWLHYGAALNDGRRLTPDLYRDIRAQEVAKLVHRRQTHAFAQAVELLDELVLSPTFLEFLTLPGYQRLD
ncbi:MAG: malate synthase A [Anaerolineae bacterium]|nr:malate synthase A [Anaerolineae bacterium]